MCGIVGMVRFDNKHVHQHDIELMSKCLEHRGPNADGVFIDRNFGLGHRRLSIIDLSDSANQPFTDASGLYWIIFNGEIYNFKEVRAELMDYPFVTGGDTEVLLAAFIKYGPKCLNKLKGMFSFAVFNTEDRSLFVARDRLGVKPLYYFHNESVFLFSSELRSILASGYVQKKINKGAVHEFLSFQSIGGPETIIEGVRQLGAGCALSIKGSQINKFQYYDVASQSQHMYMEKASDVYAKVRELLRSSVQSRLVSDVPIGVFLSGGIDSSIVVGLMAELSADPVNTFNISFQEEQFDESTHAAAVAKKFNTRHNTILIKSQDFQQDLFPGLDCMDTPTGDGINSYVVSKAVKKAGLTVALSGAGGDELFAGYPFFNQYRRLRKYKQLWPVFSMFRSLITKLASGEDRVERLGNILAAPKPSIDYLYPEFRRVVTKSKLDKILCWSESRKAGFQNQLENKSKLIEQFPELSQVTIAEYLGYTTNTLLKDMDQMSMAVSLEVREPYFDHELIEFVLKIPDDLKHGSIPKKLLVNSFENMLPDNIIHRRKQGFLFPWSEWMRTSLYAFCDERIKRMSQRDFINRDALQSLWRNFQVKQGSVNWMNIWLFVVLEYWMEKNDVQ